MHSFFSKNEISQDDILQLISTRAEESLTVEFRPASELSVTDEKKMNKISVVVSSFANTNGGILIYGIETRRKKASGLSFADGNQVTAQWLDQVILSRINRKIKGLKIHPVQFDSDPLKSLFVVVIPESADAPHMAWDNRYYKRYRGREAVMEEYEVRMMYGKSSQSDVEFFGIFNTNGVPQLSEGKFTRINFYPRLLVRNISNTIEKNYKMEFAIPSALFDESAPLLKNYFSRHDGIHSIYSIPNTSPLFQEEIATVIDAGFCVTPETYDCFSKEKMIIRIYYTGGVKTHEFRLKETFRYRNQEIESEDFARENRIQYSR